MPTFATPHHHRAPPPTGWWAVVGALAVGPVVSYAMASGAASTCGAEGDPLSCTLGATVGIGLIGFVFAVMATIAGYRILLADLRRAPATRTRATVTTVFGLLLVLSGLVCMWLGLTRSGPTAVLLIISGFHLVVLGGAAQLRGACNARWAAASRLDSGRERGGDHTQQVGGEHGRIDHGPRR